MERQTVLLAGEPHRGLLILAPMGAGKSYWINNLPENKKGEFIDGDVLLEQKGIKNRNYFWYDDDKEDERQIIIDTFEEELQEGISILYSGNPQYMDVDVMVLPDVTDRWRRVNNRDDFKPSKQQFTREQDIYTSCADIIPFVINGDLPSKRVMNEIVSMPEIFIAIRDYS